MITLFTFPLWAWGLLTLLLFFIGYTLYRHERMSGDPCIARMLRSGAHTHMAVGAFILLNIAIALWRSSHP
jgi:hypothetical protein